MPAKRPPETERERAERIKLIDDQLLQVLAVRPALSTMPSILSAASSSAQTAPPVPERPMK